ncbi:MAG: hypothetical protein IT365_20110 [Candidatus Hydrogenedentes bacterium]|nr:hypothetical protein [Candidatus Hydrogenedentota bacterium]
MDSGDASQPMDYTDCFVAFIDILGFKELVSHSKANADLRASLIHILRTAATLSETYHSIQNLEDAVTEHYKTQIRAFSDSVVLFVPSKTNALADLLRKVRYLHDRFLELGCCIRAGVTVGEMYWDSAWSPANPSVVKSEETTKEPETKHVEFDRDILPTQPITLGPALLDAYKLESEVAVYPRVIFSPRLMKEMQRLVYRARRENAGALPRAVYPFPLYMGKCIDLSPSLLDFVRMDSDGVPFLDVFHKDIDRNDTLRIEREILDGGKFGVRWIRDRITHEAFMRETRKRLANYSAEQQVEKVSMKYLWLANYFNNSIGKLEIEPIPIEWASTND